MSLESRIILNTLVSEPFFVNEMLLQSIAQRAVYTIEYAQ